MKKMLNFTVTALTLLVCVSFAAGEDEQWLRYRTSGEMYQEVGPVSYNQIKPTTSQPANIPCPKFANSNPYFARWTSPLAKSGGLWIALDRSTRNGQYDLLYIDSNANGSLADEKPVQATRTNKYGADFKGVKVLLEGEDGPVTYHLNFYFAHRPNQIMVYVSTGCWYEGEITLGGKKWHCTLVDFNANGTFNDSSTDFDKIDRIGIGPVPENTPTPTPTPAAKRGCNTPVKPNNEFQTYFMGKYLEMEGTYYRPEPAKDGAYIKFTALKDVPLGKIRVPKEITKLSAGGENGLMVIRPVDGLGQLPLGKYRLNEWQIDRKDAGDNPWQLKGSGFGDKGILDIQPGKEISLTIGEPVKVILDVNRNGKEFSFNQRMTGKLEESIELARNGDTRAHEPKLVIKNKDGTYSKSLTFEFG